MMEVNVRAECSSFLSWLPVADKNRDGDDGDEKDYNSKNDTDDHDSTWPYDINKWVSVVSQVSPLSTTSMIVVMTCHLYKWTCEANV